MKAAKGLLLRSQAPNDNPLPETTLRGLHRRTILLSLSQQSLWKVCGRASAVSKATVWEARHTRPSQTCMVLSGVILTWRKSVVTALQTDLGRSSSLAVQHPTKASSRTRGVRSPRRSLSNLSGEPYPGSGYLAHCVRSTARWVAAHPIGRVRSEETGAPDRHIR